MKYNIGRICEFEVLVTRQWAEGQEVYASGLFKSGCVFDAYQVSAITYTGKTDSIDRWLEEKE